MRAVVCDRYGPPDVLRLEEVARPAPGPDEVLVRVHATTVNRTDCGVRAGEPFISRLVSGLRRPKWRILGTEVAGTVEAAGAAVTQFTAGDEVVCDGAILALGCLRPAGVRRGQSVLIYGASGSIGTAAVQLARYFGARVTAVCGTKNAEVVRLLGADQVIDYTREDFSRNGERYDVIFDAVGVQPFGRCRGSLTPGGAYLATDHLRNVPLALWTSRFGDFRVVFPIPPRYTRQDVEFLSQLVEEGSYRAVIDRRYPLEDVIDATRYVETKQKTGNVILTIGT
jgi:NADPH:quinone reductase-like Zn-dependent oxidoreductase